MPALRLVPDQSWPTLGWQVIEWIETRLVHGPGDVEGDPVELDLEFCQFIMDVYRLYPPGHSREGMRVVVDAELSRAKGRAKSELAAMLVVAEALGPVRFDRWGADGEPVGKRVKSPFIRCLATEETQVGNTYDNVLAMLRHLKDTFKDEFGGIDIGLTRVFLPGGGEIRPSTASGSAKDGGKETFVVADEIHLYDKPELHRMFKTVKRNCRKRKAAQPWMLSTTTQFLPGSGSVAEQNRDEAEGQMAGRRKRRDSFLWDHREGLPVEDWASDEQIRLSLVEAYGAAAEWMDLDSILADEIRSHTSSEADARRYWLNQRAPGEGKAVVQTEWDALCEPREVPDGADVVLCFDGSKARDATALLGWVPGEVPYLFTVAVWERPNDAAANWQVPRGQVDGEVHAAFSRWKCRMVADPPFWREYIDAWSNEFGEDRVIEFDTNSGSRMGPAVSRFLDEAIPDGRFRHDGDLVVRRHVLNALRGKTRGGFPSVFKEKENLKIDALVAAIIGYHEVVIAPEASPIMAVPEVVFL